MIYNRILLLTLIIMVIYTLIILLAINKEPTEEKTTEEQEEREKVYLALQNMTTQEILLFKNKKEFINSIKGYDTIKYFLKGTDEENIKQLVEWYYPGFKKL